MGVGNFIPTIWSEDLERGLERNCVFAEDCNRKYQGKVEDKGDSVRILGVGSPTIKAVDRKDADADIDGPETIEDSSVTMLIDQVRYFNYKVGDIDKAQSVGGLMEAYSKETSEKLANAVDRYLAGFATDPAVHKLYQTPFKAIGEGTVVEGEKHVMHILDEAALWMRENDIPATTKVVMTVSPRFAMLLRRAFIIRDTNNSEILKHGEIGMYGNVTIKESNNVYRSGGVDHMMIRTQRALAYAQPLTHTEAYRPEKKFADAVKGFILFGGKIVRPQEILDVPVTY